MDKRDYKAMNKLNGWSDGKSPSSGIGGGKSASEWMHEATQLSGLSDYELEVEKIVDKIKAEPSTLKCIVILKKMRNSEFMTLKPSKTGIIVDKSKATKEYKSDRTPFPKGSRLTP